MTDPHRPRLVATHLPPDPQGLVLVLHGGASRRRITTVSPTQPSVLRMVPISRRIARVGRGRLAVLRLLNSHRGWDEEHSPVHDVAWALGRAREQFGPLPPVALVGHSLGGRAALLAAGAPEVRSVVALAAWLYPQERLPPLHARHILFVHGSRDRVAQRGSAERAARSLADSSQVGFVTVRGASHAMVRRHPIVDGAAADWVATTVLGDRVGGPVARVLSGEPWVEA